MDSRDITDKLFDGMKRGHLLLQIDAETTEVRINAFPNICVNFVRGICGVEKYIYACTKTGADTKIAT